MQEEKEHELHQVRAENHELRKEKDLLLQRAAGTADEGHKYSSVAYYCLNIFQRMM